MTLDTLHLVFSAFGMVQKIATFEKGQGFQALVQYSDAETAEQVRPTFRSTLGLKENACIITSLIILQPCSFQSFLCQPVSLPTMHVYSTPNIPSGVTLDSHTLFSSTCSGPTLPGVKQS